MWRGWLNDKHARHPRKQDIIVVVAVIAKWMLTSGPSNRKGKLHRLKAENTQEQQAVKGTWVAEVPARGRNAHLREAGRSWLRGPPASLQTPLTRWPGEKRLWREPEMGLPSLLHMLRACSSRDPSPALWGKDVSGSDFRLSSPEIVGNTS